MIALEVLASALQVLGGRNRPAGLPSSSQEAIKALTHLLMGKIFVPLQRCLATANRFDESALLIEVLRHDFLNQLVGIATLQSRGMHKLLFNLGGEVHFHVFETTEKASHRQEV